MTGRYAAAAVLWRSDGSEVWHELLPAPFENRGFNEARRYALRKPGDGWRLLVDDEPLKDGPDQTLWLWEPGFFAGQVTAELFRPEGTVASEFVLDVAPDPGKLGKDIFATMVDELWNEDPSLVIGSEPATNQIGDLGTLEDPWLAFARLRRYGPEFVRGLVPIRARPHRTLRVRRDFAPLHHARRVDRQTATALLHSSAVAFFATGTETAPAVSSDMRLDVPVTEETMDTTANRALLALAKGLLRRVAMVLDRLGGQVAREAANETRTPLAARWPARKRFLEELSLAARKALSSAPLSHARRAEITAAGLTVIAADPIYSRAWSRGWRAVRRGVDASPTAERLWISPSWEIYERWCFVRLSQVLRSAAPGWNWQRQRNPAELIGADGDRRAELRLQPTFRTAAIQTDGRWSISKQREPDITLTIEAAGQTRFAIFDAKYRASRSNVLDAMESAHIYQDSLRINSSRPEASFLLVPAAGGAPWLEQRAFHAEHRVGVLPLAPGISLELPAAVMHLLKA